MHAALQSYPRRLGILLLVLGLVVGLSDRAQAFWPFTARIEKPVEPAVVVPPPPDALFFVQAVRQMATDLIANLADPDPQQGDLADGLVVCSFSDLAKLTRTSSMGRLLAEQLMGEFTRQRFTVIEIRKSNQITIQEKRGEYGLSRAPEEIRPEQPAGAMLTGTYQVAGGQVVINARIMDNRNAIALASATAVLPLDGVGEKLLADAASLQGPKTERIYKKKLEL